MIGRLPIKAKTMTVEELMQPRYKVIGIGGYHYPGSRYKVGQIIGIDHGRQHYDAQNGFELYPHLFQPLPWWSDRKVEEMPEFVMSNKTGEIFKPTHFLNSWAYPNKKGCTFNGEYYSYSYLIPATLADYKAFISTTKK